MKRIDLRLRWNLLLIKLLDIDRPTMIPCKGYYLFVDYRQRIFKVVPTYDDSNPLEIHLWEN